MRQIAAKKDKTKHEERRTGESTKSSDDGSVRSFHVDFAEQSWKNRSASNRRDDTTRRNHEGKGRDIGEVS